MWLRFLVVVAVETIPPRFPVGFRPRNKGNDHGAKATLLRMAARNLDRQAGTGRYRSGQKSAGRHLTLQEAEAEGVGGRRLPVHHLQVPSILARLGNKKLIMHVRTCVSASSLPTYRTTLAPQALPRLA
jgi:hypothetical protein